MYAVIRIRGHSKIKRNALETLEQLQLRKVNHMVLLQESETSRRMLQSVKDYVTWGELTPEGLKQVLVSTARFEGNRKVNEDALKEKYKSDATAVAGLLLSGSSSLSDFSIKRVIRLHPPRKGWEAIKKSYRAGGSLGYRGAEINTLIEKMLPAKEGAV